MAFFKSLFLVATLVVSVAKSAPTNLRRELEQVPDFVLKYGMYSCSVLIPNCCMLAHGAKITTQYSD